PEFIGWWIDPSYEKPSGTVLQILMVSCLFFLPIRGVAQVMLIGMGKPRTPTFAFVMAGILNLILSIVLIRPFGLAGVALGTAIPNVLFAVIVLRGICRELDISPARYVAYLVPRAALGTLPVLCFLWLWKMSFNVDSIAAFAAAGSAMSVLFALIWVFF